MWERLPFRVHKYRHVSSSTASVAEAASASFRLSVAAIADKLNSERHSARQGGQWRPSTVHAILKRR
jgi:hypothetical protein